MAMPLSRFDNEQIDQIRMIIADDIVNGAAGTHVKLVVDQVVDSAARSFQDQARRLKDQHDEIEVTRVQMQALHDTFEAGTIEAKHEVANEIIAMQSHQQAIVKKIGDQDMKFDEHNLKLQEATVKYEEMKTWTNELEVKLREYVKQRESLFEKRLNGAEEVFQGHLKRAGEIVGQAQTEPRPP